MALHPNGRVFYSSLERESAVGVFELELSAGEVRELQSISSLPAGVSAEKNTASGIVVHPSGEYVYSSNRGHDSISLFTTDDHGLLELETTVPVQGNFPIQLALTPDARMLYAACVRSSSVSAFAVEDGGARLAPLQVTSVPTVMSTVFWDDSDADA